MRAPALDRCRSFRRDETRVPSRRFGCISSAPAPGICACRTAMPVWAWRPWGCGQGRRREQQVQPAFVVVIGCGQMTAGRLATVASTLDYITTNARIASYAMRRGRCRQASTGVGVGVHVVVDESIAMAVFRWASTRPGGTGPGRRVHWFQGVRVWSMALAKR